MQPKAATFRFALALVLAAAAALPCAAGQITVDVLNPATGSLEHFTSRTAPGPVEAMPMAPWLRQDPDIVGDVNQYPAPENVNNALLSPVRIRRASQHFSAPVSGNWRCLVLLVDFSDNTPMLYAAAAGATHFMDLLFSQGTHSTGSMRDWYREASYGTFNVTGDVIGGPDGWLRAPQTYAYYANNQRGFGPYPNNSAKLAEDIINLADPLVDFSQYDNDHDGTVDGFFIVHAGPGYETTGNLKYLHSSSWGLSGIAKDGVQISNVTIEPEDGQIGVFGHEFGHTLGLPDLYDTDYNSAGIGDYSMMSTGCWAGNGQRPVLFDAFCKESLGWITPVQITGTQLLAPIPQAETNPAAYKLWTAGTAQNEYFLVENRQRVGFDALLPATGLYIWHIDTLGNNANQWYPGLAAARHYQVALEQADGLWSMEHNIDWGEGRDTFPGLLNRRAFNTTTTPNSAAYLTGSTHISVSRITKSAALMRADLSVVNRPPNRPGPVLITPASPVPGQTLIAKAASIIDPDGDVCTCYYAWSQWTGTAWGPWGHPSRDGKLTGVTLKAGDQWKARLRVGDGLLFNTVRYGPSVTVGPAAGGTALTVAAAATPAGARGAAITVTLSAPAAVEVQVHNLAGTLVGAVPVQMLSAGVNNVPWDGTGLAGTALPAGTYLLKIVARGNTGTQAQALASLSRR